MRPQRRDDTRRYATVTQGKNECIRVGYWISHPHPHRSTHTEGSGGRSDSSPQKRPALAPAANPVDMDRPVYLGTRAATAVAAAAAAAAATVAAAAAATVAAAAARIPDEVLKQIFGGLHSCIGRSIARRFRTPFRGPRTPVSSLTAGQFKWAVLHGGLPLSVLLSRFLASRICGGSAAWAVRAVRMCAATQLQPGVWMFCGGPAHRTPPAPGASRAAAQPDAATWLFCSGPAHRTPPAPGTRQEWCTALLGAVTWPF